MLTFKLNKEQLKALEGLAYWIADENYIIERYGIEDPEITKCRETITKCIFPECDNLNIPFWVQNAVICFSENWRQYKSVYLVSFLKTRNIIIEGV